MRDLFPGKIRINHKPFSLSNDHQPLKFEGVRATKYYITIVLCMQVDPNFAYAYTLLGHEHIATEELDSALSCYRSAVRIDPRHYNAWYVFVSHYLVSFYDILLENILVVYWCFACMS